MAICSERHAYAPVGAAAGQSRSVTEIVGGLLGRAWAGARKADLGDEVREAVMQSDATDQELLHAVIACHTKNFRFEQNARSTITVLLEICDIRPNVKDLFAAEFKWWYSWVRNMGPDHPGANWLHMCALASLLANLVGRKLIPMNALQCIQLHPARPMSDIEHMFLEGFFQALQLSAGIKHASLCMGQVWCSGIVPAELTPETLPQLRYAIQFFKHINCAELTQQLPPCTDRLA